MFFFLKFSRVAGKQVYLLHCVDLDFIDSQRQIDFGYVHLNALEHFVCLFWRHVIIFSFEGEGDDVFVDPNRAGIVALQMENEIILFVELVGGVGDIEIVIVEDDTGISFLDGCGNFLISAGRVVKMLRLVLDIILDIYFIFYFFLFSF